MNAETPARYNADESKLYEASGCAGKIAVFAVRLDTYEKHKIKKDFGSFEKFRDEFIKAGTTQFGSGWCWLSIKDGKLVVTKSPNAENPLIHNMKPILGCDVWELSLIHI